MPPDSASGTPAKRLLFDRRYGWVLDEWKEPAEEALSGGRGMFCIVPLAKAFFVKASESIDGMTSTVAKVLETPEVFSPKALQSNLTLQLHKMASSAKQTGFSFMAPRSHTQKKD